MRNRITHAAALATIAVQALVSASTLSAVAGVVAAAAVVLLLGPSQWTRARA